MAVLCLHWHGLTSEFTNTNTIKREAVVQSWTFGTGLLDCVTGRAKAAHLESLLKISTLRNNDLPRFSKRLGEELLRLGSLLHNFLCQCSNPFVFGRLELEGTVRRDQLNLHAGST